MRRVDPVLRDGRRRAVAPHVRWPDRRARVLPLLAFSTRYGAQHDLARLALLLRGTHKIDLEPLTTFADRDVEVEADARELERVWQDAAPLAATLRRVNEVLAGSDAEVSVIVDDAPGLRERLMDLQGMAEWAAERNARVRLSFEL